MSWRVAGAGLLGLLALLFFFRSYVLVEVFAIAARGELALTEPGDEGAEVTWFDDYYTVEWIDDQTVALGEPRYPQQNWNYLIWGTERALLFDSGPGVREITALVASLTDLPVTAVPSHLHYDHIGDVTRFERVAVIDLPALRERSPDGVLRPTRYEFLGFFEGREPPEIRVSDWLRDGQRIDLGGREVEVLHSPGHTRDSISLYDEKRRLLLTGDYINEGVLGALLPGGSLDDYRQTAHQLLARVPDADVRLLTAHRSTPPGAPIMGREDLVALARALDALSRGELDSTQVYPRVYRVHEDLEMWADFAALERWTDLSPETP